MAAKQIALRFPVHTPRESYAVCIADLLGDRAHSMGCVCNCEICKELRKLEESNISDSYSRFVSNNNSQEVLWMT